MCVRCVTGDSDDVPPLSKAATKSIETATDLRAAAAADAQSQQRLQEAMGSNSSPDQLRGRRFFITAAI